MSREGYSVLLLGLAVIIAVTAGFSFQGSPVRSSAEVGFGCGVLSVIAGFAVGAIAELPKGWYFGTAFATASGLLMLGAGLSFLPPGPPAYYPLLPWGALALIAAGFIMLALAALRLYTPVPERGNYTSDH